MKKIKTKNICWECQKEIKKEEESILDYYHIDCWFNKYKEKLENARTNNTKYD